VSDVSDGMSAAELTDVAGARRVRWVKSTHSGPTGGNCAEVASLAGGRVAVRNSRHPAGPALVFAAADWAAFVARTRDGEFG
jgi:Domain of unknown function (DUF397)